MTHKPTELECYLAEYAYIYEWLDNEIYKPEAEKYLGEKLENANKVDFRKVFFSEDFRKEFMALPDNLKGSQNPDFTGFEKMIKSFESRYSYSENIEIKNRLKEDIAKLKKRVSSK